MNETPAPKADTPGKDFIRDILEEDRRTGRHAGRVATRFPPEPNGYLRIGHAKSICLNFGVAIEYGGTCNLRFDDTNPLKEETEYVDSIQEDVHWLGFDWGDRRFFASDYFAKLYEFGEALIRSGKAFVCDLSAEEVRATRGTLTEPGTNSPYRDRPSAESLDLFRRMRAGEFPDGSRTLRARIDMASPNINLRDPALFRIRKTAHHRTGEEWCIYPMYDYAHALSDWIERITHSLCTLEFEDHRPLYDWCLEALDLPERPRQIEFARLNLTYTLLSKRKLLHLVTGGHVKGWDDPRMPTLAGLRRRGFTPEALRDFCNRIGLAKRDSVVEVELLEHCLREDLNRRAPRVMAVLDPVRVILTNYPEGKVEELDAVNNPEDASAGTRKVPFSRELYIDRDDFREMPPPKYHRLSPGKEVRLRWGYLVRCEEVVKDPMTGAITELQCTYDPATRGGEAPDGRKVKGTIHWVSATQALEAEVRLYDRLFVSPNPDEAPDGRDFLANLNPASLAVKTGCRVEPSLASARPGGVFQFERVGYVVVDSDSASSRLVFNRSVSLRDSWGRIEKNARAGS
ncbi:MAG TPA: glutamine--tRNA ligase/YqeY domain fusion protein [Thermoanaerobaculia bacterium]